MIIREDDDHVMARMQISVAEFVRRAVRLALPASGKGTWMRYAGFVESGNPRSSRSIDKFVYGGKGGESNRRN